MKPFPAMLSEGEASLVNEQYIYESNKISLTFSRHARGR